MRVSSIIAMSFLAHSSLQALTLDEAIQKAIESNPNVLASEFASASAKESIGVAAATLYPSINLQNRGGYEYTKTSSKNSPYSVRANRHANRGVNTATLSLSQIIFDGFDTIYKIEEAEAQFEQATEALGQTQEQTAFDVARVFYTIESQNELIAIAQSSIKKHEEILAMVRGRVQGGVGTRADIEQVESRLKDAQVSLITTQTEKDRSVAEFISLVGEFPESLKETPLPVSKILKTQDEMVDLAANQNPAVKVALKQMDVTAAQYERTKAPFYPSVAFETSAQDAVNPSGTRENNGVISAQVVANYNLFNGGKDISQKKATQEKLSESKQRLAAARWASERDTRASWTDRTNAYERIAELDKAIEVNKKLTHDYDAQFHLGDRNLLDILDAYNSYYGSQASKANSEALSKISSARLLFNISGILKGVPSGL